MRRLTALLVLLMVLVGGLSARAQSESSALPSAAALPEAPATAAPAAPPAAPSPDLAPSLAPEPAAPAPLVLDQRTQTGGEIPRRQPFYRKTWFWGAVGVVLATTAIILVASAGSAGPGTPATDLGNMHAF